jgi:hypothetical protein
VQKLPTSCLRTLLPTKKAEEILCAAWGDIIAVQEQMKAEGIPLNQMPKETEDFLNANLKAAQDNMKLIPEQIVKQKLAEYCEAKEKLTKLMTLIVLGSPCGFAGVDEEQMHAFILL